MTLREAYRLLGLGSMLLAATKGPVTLAKNRIRAFAHKKLAKLLRKGL